ncbi:hypothetical protein CERSUDRAFT_117156 [Gelatoporia subvermispora B]|uniref:Uncharacterized protein n=1 Tax=Ceriporiopsis subvermispora (strain B) TaxID=914234 RepID=M2QQ21_CERS8|nr:hypothetical protein CERSUDRAFT_117156 [Gelatoporia subvermispora B]
MRYERKRAVRCRQRREREEEEKVMQGVRYLAPNEEENYSVQSRRKICAQVCFIGLYRHSPRARTQLSRGTARESLLLTYVLATGTSSSPSSLKRRLIGFPLLLFSNAFATKRPRGSFDSGTVHVLVLTSSAGSSPGGGAAGADTDGIRVREAISGGAECAERTWPTCGRRGWSAKGSWRLGPDERGGGGGGRRVATGEGTGVGVGIRTDPRRVRVTGIAAGDDDKDEGEGPLPYAAFVRVASTESCEPRPWRELYELKETFGRCVKEAACDAKDDPPKALCVAWTRYEETAMFDVLSGISEDYKDARGLNSEDVRDRRFADVQTSSTSIIARCSTQEARASLQAG